MADDAMISPVKWYDELLAENARLREALTKVHALLVTRADTVTNGATAVWLLAIADSITDTLHPTGEEEHRG